MNQWNLNIQRQVGQDWLVTANYVGNNTIHMITTENINAAVLLQRTSCTMPRRSHRAGELSGMLHGSESAEPARLSLQNPAEGRYYSQIGLIDDGAPPAMKL